MGVNIFHRDLKIVNDGDKSVERFGIYLPLQ
jgi:hypothetical protein